MKVLIMLSGGLLQASYLDEEAAKIDLEIVVADYDVEGTDMNILTDPTGEPVIVWKENPLVESAYAEEMFKLADKESES
ncbi:hypothetical protein [Acidithiobacillus sp.]|uniref:hypothetical protein n=1 Tax=Acidithiobacillus sp. TaxID=1872118 RepID=UPI003CFC85E0